MSSFSKTTSNLILKKSSNAQINLNPSENSLPNKPIFLNPEKIRTLIAKIQSKDKEDDSHVSGNLSKPSTARRYNESNPQLFQSKNAKLDSKLFQAQFAASLAKKLPKEGIHIKLSDVRNGEIEGSQEPKIIETDKYFARRSASQTRLRSQAVGERYSTGQSESQGPGPSHDFLKTLDNCLSQLALTERVVSQHKRGQSSIDGKVRQHSGSFKEARMMEVQTPKPSQQRENRYNNPEILTNREGSVEDSSQARESQLEVDTLVAQNEVLRKKIAKLRSKVKEENICKEYWHEKFKDLEKRYNSIVLKKVRQKEEGSSSRKFKGEEGGESKVLPTGATTETNYKLQNRR